MKIFFSLFNAKLSPFLQIRYILLVLILCGGFLRLYRLPERMQFLGDQGRDVIIVKRIFKDFDPVFIGPVTSVGNMYLGPLYYYFMVPFLMISYPSPVGPAYAVALLSIVTIPLIYFLGKDMVGKKPALLATTLYTFSSLSVEYSIFSWNPNPAPFISMIMIWATYKAWKNSPLYWMLVSLCFSILIQLHYMTLLTAGGAGIIWLVGIVEWWKHKNNKSSDYKNKSRDIQTIFLSTLGAACIFFISLTPLILFDLKHEFLNTRAFATMLAGPEEHIRGTGGTFSALLETHGRAKHILFDILIGQRGLFNTLLVGLTVGIVIAHIKQWKKHPLSKGMLVLIAYLLTTIVGTSLYTSSVFNHYLLYLLPVSTLFLASLMYKIVEKNIYNSILCFGFFLIFAFYNIPRYFVFFEWNMYDMEKVVQEVAQHIDTNEKYNFVTMVAHGDIEGLNYRYFFETSNHPPLSKEQIGEVETLVIINEERKLKKVTDSPIYEIVVFPNKEPSEIFEVNGVEVTILRKDN